MHKTTRLRALAWFGALLAGSASAHDLWLVPTSDDSGVTAEIGYGHDFPARGSEPVAPGMFSAPVLSDGKTTITLQATDQPYVYRHQGALADATYLMTSATAPAYWSETASGWEKTDKTGRSDIKQCLFVKKFTKAVLNTAAQPSAQITGSAQGQQLEIIPREGLLSRDQELAFAVQLDGKPLAGAQVTVNSAEYVQQQIAQARAQDKDNPHPKIAAQFSGKTDASGVVVFSGVGAGFWLAHVGHKSPYPESARCDTQSLAATLTFNRR